jgi:nitroimidazol reductase NimA-like FMN-containing flavoprotein (pyridoxamine 5'-phosphate oxidase superfamily)
MAQRDHRALAEEVIEENRYLALSTTGNDEPWVAPVEYLRGEDGTFYFFSTADARHSKHIESAGLVSAAIYGDDQPEYAPDKTAALRGVQLRGRARKLDPGDYPELVAGAIDALEPPMPPYEAYALEPEACFVPLIEDGINTRVEVELDG